MNHIQFATNPKENIAVFASAGTGKTRLLIHRILRLLLNGVDPARILAITFTRKAAAEMRERLMKELEDWAKCDDQQLKSALQQLAHPCSRDNMAKARNLYEQLLFAKYDIRIVTFHAYCQDILKRFALHAGVPPGFQVTENTTELKREALEHLYKIAHQRTEPELTNALFELLRHCGTVNNVNNLLNTFIDSCSDWWSFTEDKADPVSYAGDCLHKFLFSDRTKEKPSEILSKLIPALQRYQLYLELHPTKTNTKYIRLITDSLANKDDCKKLIQGVRYVFLTKKNTPRQLRLSKTLEINLGYEALGYEMADFIQLHEYLCDLITQQLDLIRKENLLAFNLAWFRAGQQLLNEYQKLKFERGTLDFTDLEWHTYLLLHKHGSAAWVQYKLDQQVEHILIDEFQDTNPTQWNLLLPLLEELAANLQTDNKSLFFVGDAKQSIYGFRRANPQLQFTAFKWAQQSLDAKRLETSQSFRSSPAIIELVNKVFGDKEEKPLLNEFHNHEAKRTELWGRARIGPLIPPGDETEDNPEFRNPLLEARTNNESSCHYLEGEAVAKQIKALIENSTPIRDQQQTRAVRYSDMMILARSRTHLSQLELALRDQYIPYCSISDNEFLDQLEVQDVLALLTYLIQPYNDLALAQVLRSPCFGVSDDDLMKIAGYEAETWHEKLTAHVADAPVLLLEQAFQQLQKWRALVNRMPVHDLLDRIYFDINILERYARSCPPTKRPHVRANLTYMLELALDLDAGRYSSIQSFLASIQDLGPGNTFASHANQNDEDEVQIMTIHAAKGLESPIVFLVDTGSPPPDRRAYQTVVNWPSSAARPDQFFIVGRKEGMDLNTQQVLEQQRQAEQQEELNLLYVALTRAKQYLFVSGVQARRHQKENWFSIIEQALEDIPQEPESGAWVFSYGEPPVVMTESRDKISPTASPIPQMNQPFAPVTEQNTTTSNLPTIDAEAVGHGVLVHKLLELADRDTLRKQNASPTELDALRTEVEFTLKREVGTKEFSTAIQEVRKCLTAPELRGVFLSTPEKDISTEVPICFIEKEEVLYRVIDRLIVTENSAWIIDFKTSSAVTMETMPQQAAHYRQQIADYVSAVKKLYPCKKIRVSILFTHLPALYDYDADGGLQ